MFDEPWFYIVIAIVAIVWAIYLWKRVPTSSKILAYEIQPFIWDADAETIIPVHVTVEEKSGKRVDIVVNRIDVSEHKIDYWEKQWTKMIADGTSLKAEKQF